MAAPKPRLLPPQAASRFVLPDMRLTPEALRLVLSLVEQVNDLQTRIAALEP